MILSLGVEDDCILYLFMCIGVLLCCVYGCRTEDTLQEFLLSFYLWTPGTALVSTVCAGPFAPSSPLTAYFVIFCFPYCNNNNITVTFRSYS